MGQVIEYAFESYDELQLSHREETHKTKQRLIQLGIR